MDGKSVWKVENKKPRQFENVTVWAATTRSKGSIADAKIRSLQCYESDEQITGCNGIPVKGDIFTPKYK